MVGATGFMVTPVRVSGRVVDIYGQPVPNAQVSLAANIGPDASTHTATDGSFALAGGYRVAGIQVDITAPGFLPLQQHGSGLAVLDRAPMVQGRVLDDSGAGVSGAWVLVQSMTGSARRQTVTDGDGFFWVTGLRPGAADVSVFAGDHDLWHSLVDLSANHTEQLAPVAPRQFGLLNLTTDPPGVAPSLDGVPIPGCPATPCVVSVSVGDHVVAVDSPVYVPWSQSISLARNQKATVSTKLQPKLGVLR